MDENNKIETVRSDQSEAPEKSSQREVEAEGHSEGKEDTIEVTQLLEPIVDNQIKTATEELKEEIVDMRQKQVEIEAKLDVITGRGADNISTEFQGPQG
ncbi:hypothetical protein Y032_0362g3488 [Ancylostoma ceylanicum]|uniref:Uncharacterized protein n=1 Tax=Ancylostoma ceylanicum TaxID=53326 RepID=A0A016RWD8_9BILA|nr:hypothetical protein Y032_0362g3488 [Ancylostoma ceylanicum]